MRANLSPILTALSPILIASAMLLIVSCKKEGKPPAKPPMDSTGTTMPGGGTTAMTTDIYICGADNGNACYWKNGTEVLLSIGGANFYSGEAKSIVVHDTDVYVAGFGGIGLTAGPVYWKNGVPVSLELRSNNGLPASGVWWATGIGFADSNLYVAVDQQLEGTNTLKDDYYAQIGEPGASSQNAVPDIMGAPVVNSVFASGTDVYFTGAGTKGVGREYDQNITNQFPAYFKITSSGAGEIFLLTAALPLQPGYDFFTGSASGIVVSGNDMYICGTLIEGQNNSEPDGTMTPVWWKNDSAMFLNGPVISIGSVPGAATGIFLSGTDVYISGYANINDANYGAVYWKNGVYTQLQTSSSNATSIGVTPGGDVYVSGSLGYYGSSTAVYWKNGTQTTLATGGFSVADQVFVYTH